MFRQALKHRWSKVVAASALTGGKAANTIMTAPSSHGLSSRNIRNNRHKKSVDAITECDIIDVLRETIEDEIALYKQSIRANPDDAEMHRRLGILKLLLKKRRSALEEYMILKDLFPSMADELMRKWNIKTPF
jgi:hypothetical protein